MIFILLILFSLSNIRGEEQQIEIVVDRPNYFDKNYETFSKSLGSDYLFGYSKNKACIISKGYKGYTISLQDPKSFERSQNGLINFSVDFKRLFPLVCFNYNNYGYLIFKNIDNKELSIMRGQNEKVIKNLTFDLFKFDHIQENLYLIDNINIHKINLNSLEKWWLTHNQTQNNILKTKFIGNIYENVTDFLILNNFIYFIKDYKIFKYPLLYSKKLEFITITNSNVFNYLPFKIENVTKVGNFTHFLYYFFYLFDIIMLFLCLYLLKRLGIKRKLIKNKKLSSLEDYSLPPLILKSLISTSSNKTTSNSS